MTTSVLLGVACRPALPPPPAPPPPPVVPETVPEVSQSVPETTEPRELPAFLTDPLAPPSPLPSQLSRRVLPASQDPEATFALVTTWPIGHPSGWTFTPGVSVIGATVADQGWRSGSCGAWDLDTGRYLGLAPPGRDLCSARGMGDAVSPDGQWLAVPEGGVVVRPAAEISASGVRLGEPGVYHLEVAWSPDGEQLALVREDLGVEIWTWESTPTLVRTLRPAAPLPDDVVVHGALAAWSDGRLVVVAMRRTSSSSGCRARIVAHTWVGEQRVARATTLGHYCFERSDLALEPHGRFVMVRHGVYDLGRPSNTARPFDLLAIGSRSQIPQWLRRGLRDRPAQWRSTDSEFDEGEWGWRDSTRLELVRDVAREDGRRCRYDYEAIDLDADAPAKAWRAGTHHRFSCPSVPGWADDGPFTWVVAGSRVGVTWPHRRGGGDHDEIGSDCSWLTVAPDATRAAARCYGGRVVVFDPADPSTMVTVTADDGRSRDITVLWGPGDTLAIFGPKTGLSLVSGGRVVSRWSDARLFPAILDERTGHALLTMDGGLAIFDLSTHEITAIDTGDLDPTHAAFSPDGRRLALASENTLRVVDPKSGDSLAEGALSSHRGIAWRDDGSAIFTLDRDHRPKRAFSPQARPAPDLDPPQLPKGEVDRSARWIARQSGEIMRTSDGVAIRVGPDGVISSHGHWDGRRAVLDSMMVRVGPVIGGTAIPLRRFAAELHHPGLLADFVAGRPLEPILDAERVEAERVD